MAIEVNDLPLELLENVLERLESSTIKAVRQVCRQLNQAASQFLIRTVWISTQPQDWEKLKAISEHDIFSKRVREVVYDASYYDAELLNRQFYLTTLGLDNENHESGNTITYSKTSVLRGYRIYQQRFIAQQVSLNQTGQTPERPEAGMHQPEPNNIVRAFRAGTSSPDSNSPELAYLIKALRLMPRVKHFGVSSRRYHYRCMRREAYLLRHGNTSITPEFLQQQSSFSLERGGDESAAAAIMHPRPWYPQDTKVTNELAMVWYRGFFVLQQAVAVLALPKPISMDLDIHRSPYGSFHSHVLTTPETFPWYHNFIVLPGLHDLSITLMTTGRAPSFPSFEDCRMSAIANAAPNLQRLRVEMIPYSCQGLLDLVGTFGSIIWPDLSKLRLEGFGSRENHLTDFIMRHNSSLRHLELINVGLAAANVYAVADYDLPIWKDLFHRMDSLDLEFLSIQSLWSAEYCSLQSREKQKIPRSWICDDPSRIHEFLQAGGERISSLHDIRQAKKAAWWAHSKASPGSPFF